MGGVVHCISIANQEFQVYIQYSENELYHKKTYKNSYRLISPNLHFPFLIRRKIRKTGFLRLCAFECLHASNTESINLACSYMHAIPFFDHQKDGESESDSFRLKNQNLFISNACAVRATYSFLYVVHGFSQSLRFLPRDRRLGEGDWVFISY